MISLEEVLPYFGPDPFKQKSKAGNYRVILQNRVPSLVDVIDTNYRPGEPNGQNDASPKRQYISQQHADSNAAEQ